MTTYDEIFTCFIENCGVDVENLPESDEGKYNMIQNSALHYNVIIDSGDETGEITCSDESETIDKKLDGTRLLILAYCLRYNVLDNQLVGFEELWHPHQKEYGTKNYREQISARQRTLGRTNFKLVELLRKIDNPSLM